MVPGCVFVNRESRLTCGIKLDSHRAGRLLRIDVHQARIDPELLQNLDRLSAALVVTHGTHHGHLRAQDGGMAGEVRGRAAKAWAVWKEIPKDLTEGDDTRLCHALVAPNPCSMSSSGRPLVSGTMHFTHTSWRTIMKQKKPKTVPG